MPKPKRLQSSKLTLKESTSVSRNSLDAARRQINKWPEGERKQLALMALDDMELTVHLAPEDQIFRGMFIKDQRGNIQAVASYVLEGNNLYIGRVATSGNVPGLGRGIMTSLAGEASRRGLGIRLDATETSAGFYKHLGMRFTGGETGHEYQLSRSATTRLARGS
jgi:hypothetical protein